MEKIKVLIVDDHPIVREGLRAMLQTDGGIEVVGEASDGLEAVARTMEYEPDVVLMDLRMPNVEGLEATRRIREQNPNSAVIMLTIYSDEAFVTDAVLAGASGYLLKDASRDLLCHTIRAVREGGILVKTSLLREVISTLLEALPDGRKGASDTVAQVEELTPREQEVLKLLVEGRTNKEIGNTLSIAEETAKKHVQNIIGKLGASDRTQAAVRAVRGGLVE